MDRNAYHAKQVSSQLQKFSRWIKHAVHVDELSIEYDGAGSIAVNAAWAGTKASPTPGSFQRVYVLDEVSRSCRLRRTIISDLLEAREPLKDRP